MERWSQNLRQKDDLAWYTGHSTDVAKRHYTAPDVHKASKTCSAVINELIEYSQGKDRLVDIPEFLPGVPDESCVERRDVPLPSPSGSGSDTPPTGSDTPTCVDASSSGGPSFRIWSATHLSMNGFTEENIKTKGRWKSASFYQYIRIESI